MANPFVEDWRAALVLRDRLSAGGVLETTGTGADAGEAVYASLPARLEVMQGVPLAFATSDPTTHAAARQWHVVANGTVVVTSSRLHMSSPAPGVSMGWHGLTRLYADDRGLVLEYGNQTYRVDVHCPNWLLVVVMNVGFGVVAELRPPSWVLRELAR